MTSHFKFTYKNRNGEEIPHSDSIDHKPTAVATAIGKAARAFWDNRSREERNDIRNNGLNITVDIK